MEKESCRLDDLDAKDAAEVGGGNAGLTKGGGGLLGGAAGGMSAAGNSMVQEMAQMNMQFLALQNAVQMESRKFQTL